MLDPQIDLIEDTQKNEDGFRIHWTGYDYWLNFKAYEVISWEDSGLRYFRRLDGIDNTVNISDAEVYLEGFIKWDGCAEIQCDVHLCGLYSFQEFAELLKYLHNRAHSLMVRSNQEQWLDARIEAP